MLHGEKKFLEYQAYKLRRNALAMTTNAGSGHPTSALSAADIVSALFFYAMRFDPSNNNNPLNDRFILSKGHAAPLLYAVWAQLGALPESELFTYRMFNSPLEGHPTWQFKYAEAATGSLGMGLSIGAGMCLEGRITKHNFYTYVVMGDSEITEGSIWEAAEIASFYHLSNLIGIVDCNRLGQSTQTIHAWHTQRYADKFEAFGWKTIVIDGHDMLQICSALDKAHSNERPTMIIAKTIKGYGVESVENKEGFHGKAFTKEELESILKQLDERFSSVIQFTNKSFTWKPKLPKEITVAQKPRLEVKPPHYKLAQEIATRAAYGDALIAIGHANPDIISLDGEVKNSTHADHFEQVFPERFIQCFVAEQNMVGMAIGLQKRGLIPFVSTFGVFFSRAADQIRMAAIGKSALRLVGSHAGIEIGQDGPSQMALEDISFMSALPDSIVVYPCDAVSTYKLVEQMSNYTQGISYLRITRGQTPVIYPDTQEFILGGCNVLKTDPQDSVTIIAAGITVHESLKAYQLLIQEGIMVSVIDLYCIKPLDIKTITQEAVRTGRVITVEDHYLSGGIGQAVCYALRNTAVEITCLAVQELPRSGLPQELLSWAGIDAQGIVKTVKQMMEKK